MDSSKSITKKGSHLNLQERAKVEILWRQGMCKSDIAIAIGRHKSTITREINRYSVKQRNSNLTERMDYYADSAQLQYDHKRKHSGAKIKVIQCSHAIAYVEDKILLNKWSPDAAIGRYRLEYEHMPCISTKTFYNYIDKGFVTVKPIDLLLKVKLRRKKNKVRKHRRVLGETIENRPFEANERLEYGHWEIDLVIGKKHKSSVLLTMTERKTRMEIIRKLDGKTHSCVQETLLDIIDSYGEDGRKVFKTITCDNGSEFSFDDIFKQQLHFGIYYAHPYSSFERGTNENHNSIIRRFIPKGKAIDDISPKEIKRIADWMNRLPRKILGYKTPNEAYQEFLTSA